MVTVLTPSERKQAQVFVATLFVLLMATWLLQQPFLVWVCPVVFGLVVLLAEWNKWDQKLLTPIVLTLVVALSYLFGGWTGAAFALAVPFVDTMLEKAGEIYVGWRYPKTA